MTKSVIDVIDSYSKKTVFLALKNDHKMIYDAPLSQTYFELERYINIFIFSTSQRIPCPANKKNAVFGAQRPCDKVVYVDYDPTDCSDVR